MKTYLIFTSHNVLDKEEDFRTFEVEASNRAEAQAIAESKCFVDEWISDILCLG